MSESVRVDQSRARLGHFSSALLLDRVRDERGDVGMHLL